MVDFDTFLQWAEDRFGAVHVKGNEIKINSIFTEDHKFHLWANPYGGKNQIEDGCYKCWYTNEIGTLVGLVMKVDGCSYAEAKEMLSGRTPIGILEDKLEEFFKNKEEIKENRVEQIELPSGCFKISEMSKNSLDRMEAELYLEKRKLPISGLYYCNDRESYKYYQRIMIPYYDANGALVYFNGRYIGKNEKTLRYRGPEKEIGIGKSDVLFIANALSEGWPPLKSKIYLTEGEFDALTLNVCGFYGAACGGKNLDIKQILLLLDRSYSVCLCLDNDSAGKNGLIEMGEKLNSYNFRGTFIRPPQGIKDWNQMLVTFKPEMVKEWISRKEKPVDDWTTFFLNSL